MKTISVIEAIQLILAPAVMINACGLLMLGINTKFSNVMNRIRLLNEERRRLSVRVAEKDAPYEVGQRLESVVRQIGQLLKRGLYVRNSLLCYIGAVALFVLTSLAIGLDYFVPEVDLQLLLVSMFLAGMVAVVGGIVFMGLDTKIGYDIVQFEVLAEE